MIATLVQTRVFTLFFPRARTVEGSTYVQGSGAEGQEEVEGTGIECVRNECVCRHKLTLLFICFPKA
jgi:hypothetical protein